MDETSDADGPLDPREPSPAFIERAPGVSWRRTATGVVVLASEGSAACTLRGHLAALWETLDRPTVVDATDREIRHLVAAGLVREGDPR